MEKKDRKYSNDDITVYWKPSECIHSAICYKNLLEVFNPSKRPWINLKGGTTNEIIDIVKRCPTDALTYTNNDGTASQKSPGKDITLSPENRSSEDIVKIDIIKGGPLLVEGDVKITNSDGSEVKKPKIAYFCRCGHSSRMPFCDGTHRKIGFDK